MKKLILKFVGGIAIVGLTIVNINMVSKQDTFRDISLTTIQKAMADGEIPPLTGFWKSNPNCFNDSDNGWCCLYTLCLPTGPDSCTPASCPSGSHP